MCAMVFTYSCGCFNRSASKALAPLRVVWCPENGVSMPDDIVGVKIL